jgi:hypothetical protein
LRSDLENFALSYALRAGLRFTREEMVNTRAFWAEAAMLGEAPRSQDHIDPVLN